MYKASSHHIEMQRELEGDIKLPTPPAIAVKILNNIRNENSAIEELIGIISADPALTAKLLRIANSGFYALKSAVTSIERAVALLGTNLIRNIALSFVVTNDLREAKQHYFDFDYFWRRSLTSAIAADLTCQTLGEKDDDIFVMALLHDIGIVATYLNHRQGYSSLLQTKQTSSMPLAVLEQEQFGFNHQQVASALIEKWNLPEHFTIPISYHHNPDAAPQQWQHKAAILHLSDQISALYCRAGNSSKVHQIKDLCQKWFQLDDSQITTLLDNVATQSVEIMHVFDIEPGELKPYSQMLQEANEELERINLSYEQLVVELKEAKEKSDRLSALLQDANQRLNSLVYTDGLTNLYNSRYFHQYLHKEIGRSKRYHFPLCLIMFDLDFFKKVNDTHGHPVGDMVLVNIAETLQQIVRPSDVLARYGGEEFALILPETTLYGGELFAQRLIRTIRQITTRYEGNEICVTASLGVTARAPEDLHIEAEKLLKTADKALYMSKRNGRNQYTVLRPHS